MLALREGKEHVMDRTEEAALAWALADSTAEFVDPNVRAWLCAKIGADEKATAISELLACYARSDAELPYDLATRVLAWIRGYRGTDNEQILRGLLDQIRIARAVPARFPETDGLRRRKNTIARRSGLAMRTRTAPGHNRVQSSGANPG
jgi:hypothetical protein